MAMKRGTVLMETVLVLPILTLLIFAIVQFALIWYAQIMTHYAAYNAARAALVYHPGEYTETNAQGEVIFSPMRGVCWEAACRTLAWVSSSPDGGETGFGIPGWWKTEKGYSPIPSSSHVQNQVRILSGQSLEMTNAPVVKVGIEFDYPLYVPVIGKMIAYLDKIEESSPSRWDVTGWIPDSAGYSSLDSMVHHTMGVDYITLTGTMLLPKPWSSRRFARIPTQKEDAQ